MDMATFQVPADLNGVSVGNHDFEAKNGVLSIPDDVEGGVLKDVAKALAVVLQAAASPASLVTPTPDESADSETPDQEPEDSEDGDR